MQESTTSQKTLTALSIITLILFLFPAMSSLITLWSSDGSYSHGFIIPFISAFAVWKLKDRVAAAPDSAHWPGFLPFFFGLLFVFFWYWYREVFVLIGHSWTFAVGFGLLCMIAGLTVLFIGTFKAFVLRFPICFLIFCLPIPSRLNTTVTIHLRTLASILSTWIIQNIFRIPVFREGNVLQFDNGSVGVAEACSGIRSLWVLLAVSFALSHFNKLSKLQTAIVIFAIIPVSLASNLIRVTTSGLLYAWGYEEFAEGSFHDLLGLFTFGLSMLALLGVSKLLEKHTKKTKQPDIKSNKQWQLNLPGSPILITIMIALLIADGLYFTAKSHYSSSQNTMIVEEENRKPLENFPREIGPWEALADHNLSDTEFKVLGPDEYIMRSYVNEETGNAVTLSLMYWNPHKITSGTAHQSPHSPEICYPTHGWTRMYDEDETHTELVENEAVHLRYFERNFDKQLLCYWMRGEPHLFLDRFIYRISTMIKSLREETSVKDNQYSVSITVSSMQPDTAKDVALNFTERIKPYLETYGITSTVLENK